MVQFLNDRIENMMEKGENAGYQYFLLFTQCFSTSFSFSGASKVDMGSEGLQPTTFKTFLTDNKILDLSKFANDKIIVTQILKFMLGRIENVVGKGENAAYQHFLIFPSFQKLSFPEVSKVRIM